METKNNQDEISASSFRDPAGFVFKRDGEVYRQINKSYKDDYELLMSSGLYQNLVDKQLLVSHREERDIVKNNDGYKVIKPEPIPFISYPYEWTFSQLRQAGLVLLKIQKIALKFGLSLKDASAYNVQFLKGKPILIDTLSFEKYRKGSAWLAYRQFCQHFLAPLALSSKVDIRFLQLSRLFIDGIPLDLASKSLPQSTKFKLFFLTHIHLHAKAQKRFSKDEKQAKKIQDNKRVMGKNSLLALIENLEKGISKLKLKNFKSEWKDYYNFTNYSSKSFAFKKDVVIKFLDKIQPKTVWDLGANNGEFSRLASSKGILTCAFDIDYNAVEKNYQKLLKDKDENILPLFLDLTNPSSDLGWAHSERESLAKRGPADMTFALALIHHLAISNNLPFIKIAKYFAKLGKYLVIEFVPKEDSQVQKLLSSREDIFSSYNQNCFEKEFSDYFEILENHKVQESSRVLYLMKSRLA
ncbi:MAG: SAM-dependent methyltransferase [Candidatus Pacebacteria bacterium]|nr:SAM-dependent methyltransferase [Candidatus Paceibacterota bacterium]